MKKFKATKLILSGVALAATAATLSSTTYAWYVSNQSVDASGVTGASAAGDASGNIYISKDNDLYGPNISFETTELGAKYDKLAPAWYKISDGKLYDRKGEGESLVEYTGGVITFSMYVRADNACTVAPHFLAYNKTDAAKNGSVNLPTQTAFNKINDTVTSGTTFTIDAVNALRVIISSAEYNSSAESGKEFDAATTKVYDVSSIAEDLNIYKNGGKVDGADKAKGTYVDYIPVADSLSEDSTDMKYLNAHTYYKKLMGADPFKTEDDALTVTNSGSSITTTTETSWANIDLKKDTPVKLTFTIYLDGADVSCFDACAGQSFDFAVAFNRTTKTKD